MADRDPEPGRADAAPGSAVRDLVVDTNVALDLLLFGDPATEPLARLLSAGRLRWIATGAMRSELARVLDYPAIAAQLARRDHTAARVLQAFDARAQQVGEAACIGLRSADPDDQMFIDLAVAHRALLLSRDRALLRLCRPLAALGAEVRSALALA